MELNKIRLPVLDSLRGIAACGVAFFWHFQHYSPQDGPPFRRIAYWFYHYGYNLVDFFFILSGFIFSYVYLDKIRDGKLTFYQYSILRLTRLYPLHCITLIFVAIIQFLRTLDGKNFFVYQFNDIYHFLLNILFIQFGWFESGYSFNAPTWSISSEIVAYVLFFVIIYYFSQKKKYIYMYLAMVFLGLFISTTNMEVPLLNTSMGRMYLAFFMGCITYNIHFHLLKVKNSNLIVLGIFFAFIIISTIGISLGHKAFGDWQKVYVMIIYPMIILIVLNIKILSTILSFRPLSFLGDISYSIYLWHFPVQLVIKTLDDFFTLNINYSSRTFFIFNVMLTLLISIISFLIFEYPIQRKLRQKLLPSKPTYAE